MNYRVVRKDNMEYIEMVAGDNKLSAEKDVSECISLCMENDIYILVINEAVLADVFYDLRTGLAGTMLQKFINYHVRAAIVIADIKKYNDRFREMIYEANKGNNFRTFSSIPEAEVWITKLNLTK